jgi:hypothetical protein
MLGMLMKGKPQLLKILLIPALPDTAKGKTKLAPRNGMNTGKVI